MPRQAALLLAIVHLSCTALAGVHDSVAGVRSAGGDAGHRHAQELCHWGTRHRAERQRRPHEPGAGAAVVALRGGGDIAPEYREVLQSSSPTERGTAGTAPPPWRQPRGKS